jgi:hypothetical protein
MNFLPGAWTTIAVVSASGRNLAAAASAETIYKAACRHGCTASIYQI